MSDKDELAARVNAVIGLDERITEKKMFGGLGFAVNGNMLVGITSRGELLARCGKHNDDRARAIPGASAVDFDSPRRGGFLVVPADGLEEDESLEAWVKMCLDYALSLPPK